jgi:hypothetical protein
VLDAEDRHPLAGRRAQPAFHASMKAQVANRTVTVRTGRKSQTVNNGRFRSSENDLPPMGNPRLKAGGCLIPAAHAHV